MGCNSQLGRGSEFFFELPMETQKQSTPPVCVGRSAGLNLNGGVCAGSGSNALTEKSAADNCKLMRCVTLENVVQRCAPAFASTTAADESERRPMTSPSSTHIKDYILEKAHCSDLLSTPAQPRRHTSPKVQPRGLHRDGDQRSATPVGAVLPNGSLSLSLSWPATSSPLVKYEVEPKLTLAIGVDHSTAAPIDIPCPNLEPLAALAIGRTPSGSADSHSSTPPEFEQPRRLLVVEDSSITRRLMLGLLTRMGFRVDTAENGKIAVEMVTSENSAGKTGGYDLILMDGHMPGAQFAFALFFILCSFSNLFQVTAG